MQNSATLYQYRLSVIKFKKQEGDQNIEVTTEDTPKLSTQERAAGMTQQRRLCLYSVQL